MSEQKKFEDMLQANKIFIQEGLLKVSERRPHHIFLACIGDDGQVMVLKHGGNQGMEALMYVAMQTTIIDQTRRNLGM